MNSRSAYLMAGGMFILALQALTSYGFHREPFSAFSAPIDRDPGSIGKLDAYTGREH